MRKIMIHTAAAGFSDQTSLDFDGSSEYLANTTLSAYGIEQTCSAMAWINHGSTGTMAYTDWKDTNGRNRILLYLSSGGAGTIRFWMTDDAGTGSEVDSTVVPNTGSWYQVVGTKDSTTNYHIYVNGDKTSKGSGETFLVPAPGHMLGIAARPNDQGVKLDGDVHSVAIWSSLLSDAEVTAIYNGGDGYSFDLSTDSGDYVSSANLVHWFRLGTAADGGREGTTYVVDYVDSGGIDMSANDANMADTDIVSTYPGE